MKIKPPHFILLIFAVLLLTAGDSLGAHDTYDPHTYILQKFESHDIVFLGTKHKQPLILSFIASLIPELHHAGASHICLEIPSDQQEIMDCFMKTGEGLSDIELWSTIDCPEYRNNVLATIQSLPENQSVHAVAIDLPRTRFKEEISRDEYMAQKISELLNAPSCEKILVTLGNLHMLKKLDWEDRITTGHPSIREYLSNTHPEIEMVSIAQVIGKNVEECDFTRVFSSLTGPVAIDCTQKYQNWKLGVLAPIAIKDTGPCDAFDGLIVY